MLEPALTWIRSLKDPFRSANAAAQWIAALPATDAMALQKEALELVANFPGARRSAGYAQAEALLRIDARLEPVLAQLAQQYAMNYQKSTDVETRLWHAVFDLVKAFAAAYGAVLRAGYPRAEHKRWHALLPWILVRLVHYKGIDGKFRLFRYGTWIPAQWREFHELYEFARTRGWQRNELAYGAGMFSRPGVCVEQEYLKTLLLMRLDSGNFTPDQVEWVARQLDGWAASLMLVPPPGAGASFYVDLTGIAGAAPPGEGALGRPGPAARRRSHLHPDRRADALAAGARRRRATPGRSSAARAAPAADAARLALRPGRDRPVAARHPLRDGCRGPGGGRPGAAHARHRRNRAPARCRAFRRRGREL